MIYTRGARDDYDRWASVTGDSGWSWDSMFQYFKTSANSLQDWGYERTDINLVHTDPRDLMHFPFTYSNSYIDSYSANGIVNSGTPFPIDFRGTDTVTADAWGTIRTPAGIYTNTLRVKTSSAQVYTSLGVDFSTTITTYQWFHANYRYPVLQLIQLVEDPESGDIRYGTYIFYQIPPTVVADAAGNELLACQIAPNPTSGIATVQLPDAFNVSGATLTVMDITGKTIASRQLGNTQTITLETAAWAKGLYQIRIQNAAGQITTGRLSVR